MNKCKFQNCNNDVLARNYCSTHYKQWASGKILQPITRSLPLIERLWLRVDKSGDCWIWLGATNNNGYGVIGAGKGIKYVHRVVWEYQHGTIPEGFEICHSCDTPRCVRHLYLDTHIGNMGDMARKLRSARMRLTPDVVLQIVSMRRSGISQRNIAKELNIPTSTIKTILSGRSWSHLTGIAKPK